MAENEGRNSPRQIMDYFSTEERPVTTAEMRVFWNSLTEEEKEFYRRVELK